MTTKRFIIMDNLPKGTHSNIWDKQKQHNQGIGDELWLGEVVAMLNEGVILAEENEQLKSEYKVLHTQYQDLKKFVENNFDEYLTQEKLNRQIIKLSKENEQLKKELDKLKVVNEMLSMDFTNSEHELWKENKQLKETIDELRTIDKEKDIEVEHINNIYKEFGFKGLIDYAKEKLYNFGAVREVDDGLWLLATGGWSDNEFWLDCLLHWNFMYAKGHYRATTSGGGYYYSEKPYADIKVILEDLE